MLHVANRAFLFDHTSKDETSYDTRRRSIYLPVIRNHLADVFSLFDYSDASVPNGNRPTSTIAPQALFLLNSDLLADCSHELASRLVRETSHMNERVERLYELTYGRLPTGDEREQGIAFVATVRQQLQADGVELVGIDALSMEALCHVVLVSSEYVYVR